MNCEHRRIRKDAKFQAFSQHSQKGLKKIIQNSVRIGSAKGDNNGYQIPVRFSNAMPNCSALLLRIKILQATFVRKNPHCYGIHLFTAIITNK